MDIQKEREAFEAWHYEQYLLENPNIDISNAKYIYDYAHKNALVFQLKESHFLAWQAAKALEAKKLEGCVVVPKDQTEDWYLDDNANMWITEPDEWLCDLYVGEVQSVEHKEYLITKSDTLYAAIVWDDENQDSGTWEFFKTEEEAEKAAAHCKAMLEAARGGNE